MWKSLLVTVALLCVSTQAWAQAATTPKNYGNPEQPVSTRCVSADATTFIECGSGAISSLGTSTAAAPTLVEGATASFSFDNNGNARFTLGTLISGENQTYNLLEIGWGVVRPTVVASGLAYAADCSAAPTTYGTACTPAAYVALPTGSKTFTARLTSSTSADTLVAQTIYIYGGDTNTFTSDTATLACMIQFPAATQSLLVGFTQTCPVTGNWLYYGAVTFGTDAGVAHATRANVTSAVTAKY